MKLAFSQFPSNPTDPRLSLSFSGWDRDLHKEHSPFSLIYPQIADKPEWFFITMQYFSYTEVETQRSSSTSHGGFLALTNERNE